MKKLFFLFAMIFIAVASHAQNFVTYDPINTESQNQEVEQMYAYVLTDDGFQRIRIKVATPSYGSPKVVAYIPPKQKSSVPFVGYNPVGVSKWRQTNARVEEVTQYDSDYIYRNFDYKSYISGIGYIYF